MAITGPWWPFRRLSGAPTCRPGTTGTSAAPWARSSLSSSTCGWVGARCTTTHLGASGTGGSACESGPLTAS
eukprot:11035179-Alexandrium_andersonii.AAC.1